MEGELTKYSNSQISLHARGSNFYNYPGNRQSTETVMHLAHSHFCQGTKKGVPIRNASFLLTFRRTPWSCGHMYHVLDQEVKGSNHSVAKILRI